MTDKSKQLKGTIAALIVNIIFGFSFLFSKIALSYAHPLIILAVRFTVAFAVLNLLWMFGIVKLNFKGKPKKRILLMSLAQPLLYFILELYGIENTSSAMSGVIISLVPVVVIILSAVFLKEKPTVSQMR
ncbi:MAG: DMT family transporter [Ruminococcus sp.]|nr:DMT family transporter [Ruminococcus sp.]